MIRIIIFLIFTFTLNAQVITNNSFNSSNSIAMAGATVSNPGKLESIFSIQKFSQLIKCIFFNGFITIL